MKHFKKQGKQAELHSIKAAVDRYKRRQTATSTFQLSDAITDAVRAIKGITVTEFTKGMRFVDGYYGNQLLVVKAANNPTFGDLVGKEITVAKAGYARRRLTPKSLTLTVSAISLMVVQDMCSIIDDLVLHDTSEVVYCGNTYFIDKSANIVSLHSDDVLFKALLDELTIDRRPISLKDIVILDEIFLHCLSNEFIRTESSRTHGETIRKESFLNRTVNNALRNYINSDGKPVSKG